MNYELAKKLKDAGFPQNWKEGCLYQDGRMLKSEIYYDDAEYGFAVDKDNTIAIVIPTLSELIEAVQNIKLIYTGEENTRLFFLWMDLGKIWTASIGVTSHEELGFDKKTMFPVWKYSSQGDTPEESVANLWIKLNENNSNNTL